MKRIDQTSHFAILERICEGRNLPFASIARRDVGYGALPCRIEERGGATTNPDLVARQSVPVFLDEQLDCPVVKVVVPTSTTPGARTESPPWRTGLQTSQEQRAELAPLYRFGLMAVYVRSIFHNDGS
jgi:hypothetical protein